MGRAVLNWLVILFQKSKLRVKEKHKQNLKSVLKFSSCGSVSLIFSFLTLAFYDHLSFPVWFTALNKSDTHLKVQNKSCKMETLETMYHLNDFLWDIPPPLACQQIGLTHTPGLSQTQQIQGPHQSKPLSPSLNLKSMSISSSTRETRTVDHLACSLPHLGIPWLPIPLLILLSLENSDNANNLHLLLWMIAPPRCTSLLSSCVCDLLQNMGNHKSPYPLAGAIR